MYNRGVTEIRPGRAAAVVALLVSVLCAAMFVVEPIPGFLARLTAGSSDLPLYGGLHLEWKPPAGLDTERLVDELNERHTVRASVSGGVMVIEIAGLDEEAALDAGELMAGGPFEMRAVIDDNAELGKAAASRGLQIDLDRFRDEQTGSAHAVTYAKAATREVLEKGLAGWTPPQGTAVGYERLEIPKLDGVTVEWHAYLVGDRSLMPPSPIQNVYGQYDPNTNRPILLMEFTHRGAEAFAEVTGAITGHKLAMLVGGRVRSAPVINSRIPGGRAVITMGGSDMAAQERERDALVASLRAGGLPAGGAIVSLAYVPASASTQWLARIVGGLLGGLIAGLIAVGLVRFARPRRPVVVSGVGGVRVGALVVTILVPIAVVVIGPQLFLPAQKYVDLDPGMTLDSQANVFMLGLSPIVEACVVVELLALCARPWRALRSTGPDGRRRLAIGIAFVAIVFALVQAWVSSGLMQSWGVPPELGIDDGVWARITTTLALVGGVLLLAQAAALIHARGHGSGYAAILTVLWLSRLRHHVALDPAMHAPQVLAGVVGAVCFGLVLVAVSRWRVGARGAAPAAGIVAAQTTSATQVLVGVLGSLGFGRAIEVVPWATGEHHGWLLYVVGALFAVGWTWLLARPSLTARYAARAGVGVETWRGWAGSAAVSVAVTLLALAMTSVPAHYGAFTAFVDVLHAPLAVAAVMDVVADVGGRRKGMVNVWVVQNVQHVPVVEEVLAKAGILGFVSCTRTRALFAWFGAFVPMSVYVPAAEEQKAAGLLRAVFDESVPPPTVDETFA